MHTIPIAVHVAITTSAHTIRSDARWHPAGIVAAAGTRRTWCWDRSLLAFDAVDSELVVMSSAAYGVAEGFGCLLDLLPPPLHVSRKEEYKRILIVS